MRKSAFTAVFVAALAALSTGTAADEPDHERARHALERGEVLPLQTILGKVAREYPGDVVEVELEREDGRWVYEIELIGERGRLTKLEVDARDGSIIDVKGRGARRGDDGGQR